MYEKSGAPGHTVWVLVVEDDDTLRQTIMTEMQRASFKPIGVDSSVDAVLKLRNQKFDCVILDYKLKKGNGEEVIRFMRRDHKEFNFYTPIILVSGFLDKELLGRVGHDIKGVLVKPFDKETLMSKIRDTVNQHHAEEAARNTENPPEKTAEKKTPIKKAS